ncbi:MAG: hypothetical protein FJ276_37325, partial [Planctomycetes bacterium]|nr:hypothetical protein [Planctomycetota bacterium]
MAVEEDAEALPGQDAQAVGVAVQGLNVEGRPHREELALAPVGLVREGDAVLFEVAGTDRRAALIPLAVVVVRGVPALQLVGQLDVAEASFLAGVHAVVAVVPRVITDLAHLLGEGVEIGLHPRQVLVVARGKQEEARQRAGNAALVELLRVGIEPSGLLDDLFRLVAVERPGLAIGTQHGDGNGFLPRRLAVRGGDIEDHPAVAGLGLGERVAQRDKGIETLERDSVDPRDDLALAELTRGRRAGHRLLDLDGHARVNP